MTTLKYAFPSTLEELTIEQLEEQIAKYSRMIGATSRSLPYADGATYYRDLEQLRVYREEKTLCVDRLAIKREKTVD